MLGPLVANSGPIPPNLPGCWASNMAIAGIEISDKLLGFSMSSRRSKVLKQCESRFHRLERQGDAGTSRIETFLVRCSKKVFAQTKTALYKTTNNNLVGQNIDPIQGEAPTR